LATSTRITTTAAATITISGARACQSTAGRSKGAWAAWATTEAECSTLASTT
jgi:hypothetical protein